MSPWARLVTVSAVLVLGGAVALVSWGLGSQQRRVVSYGVNGSLDGVSLNLGGANVTIVGGGSRTSVAVQRRDRYAFGHDADSTRSAANGVFRIYSRCPRTVFHACTASYRLVVPDNVPVDVRTDGGKVTLDRYRGSARIVTHSGDVNVSGFCGFSLQASTGSGDVSSAVACAPQQLALRSTSGDVRALVPDGRYRVDAESGSGTRIVSGLTPAADAVFSIQALSTSGDVQVEAR
jgi:hypothetical protein